MLLNYVNEYIIINKMGHQKCKKCHKCNECDNIRFNYHHAICNRCHHHSKPIQTQYNPYHHPHYGNETHYETQYKTTKIYTINDGPKGDKGCKGCQGTQGIDGATGPQGQLGETGPQGPIGATGEKGLPGTQGIDGVTGPNGPVGATGEKGEMGATGANGAPGATGQPGAIGATGEKGEIGSKGPTGDDGATGEKGEIGDQGPTGNPGSPGPLGSIGPDGPQGPTGDIGLKGDTGDAGPYPEQINILELTKGYLVDSSGLVHPANAQYIEFTIIGGGGGGTDSLFEQLGLDIDGEASADESGYSVSVNGVGDIVAIGAIKNDGSGNDRGHTKIYQFNGTMWTQLGQNIYGDADNDFSGWSVSINDDGTIVAIGSPENDASGNNSGYTKVYEYNGSIWVQLGQNIGGEAANDVSGKSVTINSDGTVVAIGATRNDGNGGDSGHTRIFKYNGSIWQQLGQDIDGEVSTDQAGRSVSINNDGTIVAIGASNNDGSGNLSFDSGHTRVYEYNGSIWVKLGQDIDGESIGDESGYSVSINGAGNIVVIGAPKNDSNGNASGKTRVYQYISTSWVQIGQDIVGENEDDESGHSVSINNAGNIIAIGAIFNNGPGSNRGHVRIFKYNGSIWVQTGQDIDGEQDDGQFGYSVSLNNIGDAVAIGAPFNNGNGVDSGHVRVYSIDNGAGDAGEEIKIKTPLPGNFSFTIGSGGSPGNNGSNTVLVTDLGSVTALGGSSGNRNSLDGAPGYYNGYGAGGGNVNGSGGSNKASDGTSLIGGTGGSGYVLVTYS
jgi:hypothetical protein